MSVVLGTVSMRMPTTVGKGSSVFGAIIHILLHHSLGSELLRGLIDASNEPVRLGTLGTFEAWAVIVASLITVLGGFVAGFMVIHRGLNRIEGTTQRTEATATAAAETAEEANKELKHNGGKSTKDLAAYARQAAELAQSEASQARASALRAEQGLEEIRKDLHRNSQVLDRLVKHLQIEEDA